MDCTHAVGQVHGGALVAVAAWAAISANRVAAGASFIAADGAVGAAAGGRSDAEYSRVASVQSLGFFVEEVVGNRARNGHRGQGGKQEGSETHVEWMRSLLDVKRKLTVDLVLQADTESEVGKATYIRRNAVVSDTRWLVID